MRVLPFVLVVLAGCAQARPDETDMINEAKTQVARVEQAAEAYKNEHGDYPPALEVLLQPEAGAPAFLERKTVTDPWGRRLVYDAATRHPQSGRPLVYSEGPRQGAQAGRVTNGW